MLVKGKSPAAMSAEPPEKLGGIGALGKASCTSHRMQPSAYSLTPKAQDKQVVRDVYDFFQPPDPVKKSLFFSEP